MSDLPAPHPEKRCPRGHPLRTKIGKRRCGVRGCAEDVHIPLPEDIIDLDAQEKMDPKDLAFAGRAQLALMPSNLKGEDAQRWAQDKLVSLLPEAVASVMHDLRYGNDKVRSEAADKVLRANGLDKREAAQGGGGLIVLNIGTQGMDAVPWLQRMPKGK